MPSELFEQLPSGAGRSGRFPLRLRSFFDEAHLLFDDAPKALIEKVERVARLIRSKGVSIWFVTQNPADIPESVLGQLGNRVYSTRMGGVHRQGSESLARCGRVNRSNPTPISTSLEMRSSRVDGEAATSFLQRRMEACRIAQRTLIRPPFSQVGPITDQERAAIRATSPMGPKYDTALDRDSAHEMLARKTQAAAQAASAKQLMIDLGCLDTRGCGTGRPYAGAGTREVRLPRGRSGQHRA